MAIQPNSYFGRDPFAGASAVIEDAGTSIGQALFGTPGQAGQRGLRTAQAREANTNADIGQQTIETNRRKLDAQAQIGDAFKEALLFRAPDGSVRPATQGEILPKLGPLFQNLSFATGANPDQLAGLFRAFTGMTQDEALTRSGYAATGANLGPDFAGTTGRADAVQARNAKSAKDQATSVAGISAGATVRAAQLAQDGAMARQAQQQTFGLANPGPLVVPPNNDVVLPPGDPRRAPGSAADVPTTVSGQRTRSVDDTRAEVMRAWINGFPEGPERQAAMQAIAVPGLSVAQTNATSRAQVASLAAEGRITAAQEAGWARVEAAKATGGARVEAADLAAHAAVEAATVRAGAARDVAQTGAGSRERVAQIGADGNLGVAQTNATSREAVAAGNNETALGVAQIGADGRVAAAGARPGSVPVVSAAADRQLTRPIRSWKAPWTSACPATPKRASSCAQRRFIREAGPGQKNPAAAMRQAFQEFVDSNPKDDSTWLGRQFLGSRFTAPKPVAKPGGASLVPAPADRGPPAGGDRAATAQPRHGTSL
jgi:hypothetical protein